MNLAAIQQALRDADIDGWLFYDFHHRDQMAYTILGLDIKEMTTRRWFYWIPAAGEPVKLSHTVEPRRLDPLPGRQEFYLPWTQLREKLAAAPDKEGNTAAGICAAFVLPGLEDGGL